MAAIMNIDKALLRVSAELGVRMAGEGFEEGLQNILEPVFRNIAFGESHRIEINADTWYQMLIGAITAGLLEGAPTVARNISNTRAGYAVQQAQKVDALITNALTLDPKTEAGKLAGRLADGIVHENQYNIGELLRAYVDAGGDTTFMYTPNLDTLAQSIQTRDGEILVPELPDVDAVLADNSARTKNVLADTLDALGNISVDTTTANRAYYDYLTANEETKAAALSFAVDAINATIDTAIAQRQAEGGDASALTGLKMQMDGALSGAGQGKLNKLVAESRLTGAAVQSNSANVPQSMTHAVYMLLKLPANVQTQANVEAARQAYYDYLTASEDNKAAAYDNAAKLLSESVKASLETAGLDAGTRRTLQMLLDDIDSERRARDNGSIDIELLGKDELIVADNSFLDTSGKVDWNKHAPSGGFKTGTKIDRQSIVKGNIIDRYGNEFGRYASPLGTTYDQRSLPYVENPNAYHRYLVIKDITNVSIGEIAAAFNYNGGGTQYLLPSSIRNLIKNGYVRRYFNG